jgi:hypothetical protein
MGQQQMLAAHDTGSKPENTGLGPSGLNRRNYNADWPCSVGPTVIYEEWPNRRVYGSPRTEEVMMNHVDIRRGL